MSRPILQMIGRLVVITGLFFLAIPARADSSSPYLAALLQEAHAKQLAHKREWRLLLHDHQGLFVQTHSDVNAPAFFLAPKGRRDPSAEMDATLKAFFEPAGVDSDTQHPQCRFPARYAWLKEQLHFTDELPEQPCPRFDRWRLQMDPESVTLIFASYYLDNPASMYGHTFLRLNRKGHTDKERLLDYVVNFAAVTDSTNGLAFAVKGLAGGYNGTFSTLPYYVKVQQYNNLESRDLWEYTLTLNAAELDRLVRHLWELGQASMAYYFLNRNCSYQLLPLLEVARPSLHLADPFWLKAIPADTLRAVIRQRGMLSSVQMRPSHVSLMLARRGALSKPEIHAAGRLADQANPENLKALQVFPLERQAKILDSAYDLFRYRIGFAREQPLKNQEQERSLLVARNQVGLEEAVPPASLRSREDPAATTVGSEASPDYGHPTGRVGASFGWTKHTRFEELTLRPALHDQDDNTAGYIPGSQLQMFHLRLRYDDERQKAWVQDFTLIDILSLSPWDQWVRKPSWNLHTGVDVANDLDRAPEQSLYYGFRGGSGLAYQTHLWRRELVYAQAEADSGVGGIFRDNYRVGGGMISGIVLDAASWWRIHFDAAYLRYPVGETGEAVKLQLIQAVPAGRNAQFRCTLERQNAYKEALLSFLIYL